VLRGDALAGQEVADERPGAGRIRRAQIGTLDDAMQAITRSGTGGKAWMPDAGASSAASGSSSPRAPSSSCCSLPRVRPVKLVIDHAGRTAARAGWELSGCRPCGSGERAIPGGGATTTWMPGAGTVPSEVRADASVGGRG